MSKTFKYVYIPWDVSEEIQERQMTIPEGKDVECLLDELKVHFGGNAKSAAQRDAQRQALLKNLPEGQRAERIDDVLNAAVSMQMVENVGLLNNSPATDYVGVNMYVDDEGAIKGLPSNPRASSIAQCCGKHIEVKGDAFIARVFDNEDEFKRLDFTLNEMSSDAAWVRQAAQQTRDRERSETPQQMLDRMHGSKTRSANGASAATRIEELSEAEAAKHEGNEAFKAKRYEDAAAHYSRALELDASLIAARNNRAAAFIHCQRYEEAIADCNAVLQADARNVKALLRRGTAYKHMNNADEARASFSRALSIEPKNAEAKQQLASLDRL